MGKARPLDYRIDANGCFICISHKARVKKGNNFETVRIWREGRAQLLHRWIYAQMFGPIPNGMVVRHKCDNGQCINPEHMELGTQKQNVHDAIERGRFVMFGRPVVDNFGDNVDKVDTIKEEG